MTDITKILLDYKDSADNNKNIELLKAVLDDADGWAPVGVVNNFMVALGKAGFTQKQTKALFDGFKGMLG